MSMPFELQSGLCNELEMNLVPILRKIARNLSILHVVVPLERRED
jgi:hypothetical protein